MPFSFEKTTIDNLVIINPHVFSDKRGHFIKDFEKIEFMKQSLPINFSEINESKSKKGTLRGLHFQEKNPQGKLLRVVQGSIYDIAVDLRPGSKTYGEWEGFYLNDSNNKMIYIPENFAHGFLTLEDETIITYKCTNDYSPEFDSGIIWSDNDLNIEWPLNLIENNEIIISEKDQNLQTFREYHNRINNINREDITSD